MLPIYRWLTGVGIAIALLLLQPATAQAAVNPAALARAVQEVEQLDMLRSGLASSLEGQTEAPTMETMKEVCRPVGMRAMALSQENGWQVKQIATKYRNPAHAPDT
ncbi:c-type heme family protein, partial [Trichothermofontia sp.]